MWFIFYYIYYNIFNNQTVIPMILLLIMENDHIITKIVCVLILLSWSYAAFNQIDSDLNFLDSFFYHTVMIEFPLSCVLPIISRLDLF